MATRHFCDRCNKEYPDNERNKLKMIAHVEYDREGDLKTKHHWDICEACFSELVNWIRAGVARIREFNG